MLQYRHPFEFGGLYFTTVLLTTPAAMSFFGHRYLAYFEDEEVKATLKYEYTSKQIYGGQCFLAIVQVLEFATLMYIIPSTHRRIFFSTQTGSQFVCTNLRATTDDEAKLEALSHHTSLWAPIKEEIETWVEKSCHYGLAKTQNGSTIAEKQWFPMTLSKTQHYY